MKMPTGNDDYAMDEFYEQEANVRSQAVTKIRPGSFTVYGAFLHLQKAQPAKPGKKDPPRKFEIMLLGVDTLIKNDCGAYTVGKDHISVGHSDTQAVQAAAAAMKEDSNEETIAALAEAEEPKGYTKLTDGMTLTIGTFAKGNLENFKFRSIVQCLGFKGEYSKGAKGQEYFSFMCDKVIPLPNGGKPFAVQLESLIRTENLLIPYPSEQTTYMSPFMIVADYCNRLENGVPPKNKTSSVVFRFHTFSRVEERFKFGKEEEPKKAVLPISVEQKQWDEEQQKYVSHWVVGTCYDSDVINRNFGITDLNMYCKIMAANQIPFYAVVSCNLEKTRSNMLNGEERKMTVYVNDIFVDLRIYLLHRGVPLSFEFVKKHLGQGKSYLKRDNGQNPLNQLNEQINGDGSIKLINGKVLNINFYSGDLDLLVNEGVEWRAMHSAVMTPGEMSHNAKLRPEEGDALIMSCQPFVIYAVVPLSPKELQWYTNPREKEEEDKQVAPSVWAEEPPVEQEEGEEEEEEDEKTPMKKKRERTVTEKTPAAPKKSKKTSKK